MVIIGLLAAWLAVTVIDILLLRYVISKHVDTFLVYVSFIPIANACFLIAAFITSIDNLLERSKFMKWINSNKK